MGWWSPFYGPTEPTYTEDDYAYEVYIAERESMDEFIEREISYEEAMAEDIASDEGGWGGRDFEG